MWETLIKLFWWPFQIMQRISRRFLSLGRSVFGGLLGGGNKPNIEPRSASSSPSPLVQQDAIIDSDSVLPVPPILDPESFPPGLQPQNLPRLTSPPRFPTTHIMTTPQSTTTTLSMPSACAVDIEEDELCSVVELPSAIEAVVPGSTFSQESNDNIKKYVYDDDLEIVSICDVGPPDPAPASSCSNIINNNVVDDTDTTNHSVVVTTMSTAEAEILLQPQAQTSASSTESTCADGVDVAITEPSKRYRDKEKRKMTRQKNKRAKPSVTTTVSSEQQVEDTTLTGVVLNSPSIKKLKLSEEAPSATPPCSGEDIDKPKRKKRRPKKKNKQGQQGNAVTEDPTLQTTGSSTSGMAHSFKPNFFIAVQISCKDILSKVSELQKSLTEKPLDPPWHGLKSTEIFKDAMVPVQKLHFTLHVMHLEGEEDIERAQTALVECCSEVQREFVENPLHLTIEGIGHFKSSVLFAQLKNENSSLERLTKLSDLFRKKFDDLNIRGDPRPFKAHMTIAKVSRSNKLYKRKIRAFPPEIWSDFEETHFGRQRMNKVQLLCMAGEDKATGYYRCFGQYEFTNPLKLPQSVPLSSSKNENFSSEKDLRKGEDDTG